MERVVVDAIARCEPSVVAIGKVAKPRSEESLSIEAHPDPFARQPISYAPPLRPTDPDFHPTEYATGVVVDPQGLILTAYHVLGDDCDYYVTTPDQRRFSATVKAADPRSDLAVLSVEATDLKPITFGDAATLKRGQFVIALGNPYGIAKDGQVSASWGMVSNLARKAFPTPDPQHTTGKSTLHHCGTLIQTDAKLNLGTSGGPLLNLRGEMVGLTTALAAIAGYEQSAGYAFPVDETFRRVVETLKRGREVEYGFLGVGSRNLPLQPALHGIRGALVDRVLTGTPAERCGLEPGDVIAEVNGRPIRDGDGLVLEVGRLPVEASVRLGVIRDGRRLRLDIELTKYRVRGKKIVTAPAPVWRGVRVDYVTGAIDVSEWGGLGRIDFDDGVIITDVERETAASQAGLEPGMLVSHVDRVAVHNPRQFHQLVSGKTGSVELQLADQDGENRSRALIRGS
jgi:serine protease Do